MADASIDCIFNKEASALSTNVAQFQNYKYKCQMFGCSHCTAIYSDTALDKLMKELNLAVSSTDEPSNFGHDNSACLAETTASVFLLLCSLFLFKIFRF